MQEETGCTYPQGRSSGQRRISLWCLDLAFLASQVIAQSQSAGAERGSRRSAAISPPLLPWNPRPPEALRNSMCEGPKGIATRRLQSKAPAWRLYQCRTRGPMRMPTKPGKRIPTVYQLTTNAAAFSLQ
jgi:hypothetical protein